MFHYDVVDISHYPPIVNISCMFKAALITAAVLAVPYCPPATLQTLVFESMYCALLCSAGSHLILFTHFIKRVIEVLFLKGGGGGYLMCPLIFC